MDPTPPTPWRSTPPPTVRAVVASVIALAGSILSGCAADDVPLEETDAVTGTSASGAPEGYPEGPYGADVGEVLPNLVWKGYVDDDGVGLATEGDYVDLDLEAVRRGGARWALVHFGTVF